MARLGMGTIIAALIWAAPGGAQEQPWRFHWQAGQILTYRVDHNTVVAEVVGDSRVETSSKLILLKRWTVTEVDAQGVATLKLSLAAMRHEQSRPNGDKLLFDSANPDKSTPELREQMSKYVGQTLAVLRVDGQGKVAAVEQGSASKYETEPPFLLRLPAQGAGTGKAWERNYEITLDPPLGTGEKHAAVQRYDVVKVADGLATIRLATRLKAQPDNAADRLPLLQKQPEGELVFNIAAGRLESATLRIDKQIDEHQGKGSSYHFTSTYREQYVPSK